MSELGERRPWPRPSGRWLPCRQATAYADPPPPSSAQPSAAWRRFVALFWGGLNLVVIAVAAFGGYFAMVTAGPLPALSFEATVWGAALLHRFLLVAGGALALAAVLHIANRLLFGWAHGREPAPEPRALAGLFLAGMSVAAVVGAAESLLVHLM